MEILYLYTDGGAFQNPGPGGAGGVLLDENKKEIENYSVALGIVTNNEAEYLSLILGLQRALKYQPKTLKVFSDSELMIRQLTGKYKVKNQRLKKLFAQVLGLTRNFSNITFHHIPREENKKADSLVKKAILEQIKKEK